MHETVQFSNVDNRCNKVGGKKLGEQPANEIELSFEKKMYWKLEKIHSLGRKLIKTINENVMRFFPEWRSEYYFAG